MVNKVPIGTHLAAVLKWEMGAELPRNSFSVAKEGKVFEQKKLLQPLLGTPEGTKMTGTIFFLTSPTLTVYSNEDLVYISGQS